MDNREAIGYMLLAAKKVGLTKEITKNLYSEMYYMFDIKTENEAEQEGFDWYYNLKD
ncbi:hypothetical protein ACJ2A9_09570 [Anaerobacillus sp. MEB173]|uniref:hypothetical protein n=1 Tax=Anaerobacillus sp. MEB173 TaxID=3383345 RepID=UPI003F9194B1